MELNIFTERDQSTTKIIFKGKNLKELLTQLKINSETVIIVRKGEVIIEDEFLKNKDKLEILSVISGG